jgi:two-component system response regulator YesN
VTFTGAAAINAVDEMPVEFILLDFALPDVNSSELFAKIRRENPAVKICIMTGYGDHQVYESSEGFRNETVLVKPLDMALLLALLD